MREAKLAIYLSQTDDLEGKRAQVVAAKQNSLEFNGYRFLVTTLVSFDKSIKDTLLATLLNTLSN